jgi:hypothetical protein
MSSSGHLPMFEGDASSQVTRLQTEWQCPTKQLPKPPFIGSNSLSDIYLHKMSRSAELASINSAYRASTLSMSAIE